MGVSAKEAEQLHQAVSAGRANKASLSQLADGYELAQREGLSGIGDELAGRIHEKSKVLWQPVPWGTVFVGLLIGVLSNLIARRIK